NSPKATKKSYDKEFVKKVVLLVNDGFDPCVWEPYNSSTSSQSRIAILNLIAHFVESGGKAFADSTYILTAVQACARGENLNIEFPALFTTHFGTEFGRLHSSRYGHMNDCNFDDEMPFTVATEEIFLPNVRGYKLNMNNQHLQKYMASRKKQNIMLQGNFFNGAAFKLVVTAKNIGGGDTLSYKFKARRCNLRHRINGLNVMFDIEA
ncbi:TPA: hypothetical protein ACVU44_004967, partial [Vibrio parahaemolyticus]|nr:hypothetical protein [Vibrio parahaemolyticus]